MNKDRDELDDTLLKLKSVEQIALSLLDRLNEIKDEYEKSNKENVVKLTGYTGYSYYSANYLNNNFNEKELGKKIAIIKSTDDFHQFIKDHVNGNNFKGIQLGNLIGTKFDFDDSYDGLIDFSNKYIKDETIYWIVTDFKDIGTFGLFPVCNLLRYRMNDNNITLGGYNNSILARHIMPKLLEELQDRFFGMILSSEYHLLDEYELFGKITYQVEFNVNKRNRLPLFEYISLEELVDIEIFSREDFWLRGVASSAGFCVAGVSGYALYTGASHSLGVRPLIYVGYPIYD